MNGIANGRYVLRSAKFEKLSAVDENISRKWSITENYTNKRGIRKPHNDNNGNNNIQIKTSCAAKFRARFEGQDRLHYKAERRSWLT